MSANSGRLSKGGKVYHRDKLKTVKDWFFVSDSGMHNSDLIIIQFTDGTNTKDEGFSKIRYK